MLLHVGEYAFEAFTEVGAVEGLVAVVLAPLAVVVIDVAGGDRAAGGCFVVFGEELAGRVPCPLLSGHVLNPATPCLSPKTGISMPPNINLFFSVILSCSSLFFMHVLLFD